MKSIQHTMALGGRSGLFELVAHSKNGIIVASLEDGKRLSISGTHPVHALHDIAMYTEEGEKPLREIYEAMGEALKGEPSISHKSSGHEIEKVFGQFVPDYDADKVYQSDMKKFINWYNLLVKYGFFLAEDNEADQAGVPNQTEAKPETQQGTEGAVGTIKLPTDSEIEPTEDKS